MNTPRAGRAISRSPSSPEGRAAVELWDIYDKDRVRTGRTKPRGSELLPGEYHLVVHVCLFNGRGEMLIQQRQTFKKGWPGMWDVSVGGSALAGETSREAAERETGEELGYQRDMGSLRPHMTVSSSMSFDDFYLLEDRDLKREDLTLQEEEVREVRWAGREEIGRMIDRGVFVPYHPGLLDALFDMRQCMGCFRS